MELGTSRYRTDNYLVKCLKIIWKGNCKCNSLPCCYHQMSWSYLHRTIQQVACTVPVPDLIKAMFVLEPSIGLMFQCSRNYGFSSSVNISLNKINQTTKTQTLELWSYLDGPHSIIHDLNNWAFSSGVMNLVCWHFRFISDFCSYSLAGGCLLQKEWNLNNSILSLLRISIKG